MLSFNMFLSSNSEIYRTSYKDHLSDYSFFIEIKNFNDQIILFAAIY
jgi:hypothetical protein